MNQIEAVELLQGKIKALSETVWENRVKMPLVLEWLEQFDAHAEPTQDEQLQALFLLSHFLYFGQREIRELLRAVYRDVFCSRLIAEIRHKLSDTRDRAKIAEALQSELASSRFLGMGNPAESGTHLLYYFRQENSLQKHLFIHTHEIFGRGASPPELKVRDTTIKHYVFIDDLCGSGTQASAYSAEIVAPLKALNPCARAYYLPLLGTTHGLNEVRRLTKFDVVEAVTELDESFRCFEEQSRCYANEHAIFSRLSAKEICARHGSKLVPEHPLGYKEAQMLLGFNHNTPDNTLPIFWYDEPNGTPWTAIFKRYSKLEFGP